MFIIIFTLAIQFIKWTGYGAEKSGKLVCKLIKTQYLIWSKEFYVFFFHIRIVHLDIIKVFLFTHQLMH